MSQIQSRSREMNQPGVFRDSFEALVEKHMGEINQRRLESLEMPPSNTKGINEALRLNQVFSKLEQESETKDKVTEERYEKPVWVMDSLPLLITWNQADKFHCASLDEFVSDHLSAKKYTAFKNHNMAEPPHQIQRNNPL